MTSLTTCPVCGCPLRVVGRTTQHYEAITPHPRNYLKALVQIKELKRKIKELKAK